MENIQFTFDDKQNIFAQLLTKTLGTPHGQLPTEQEDDKGNVWEFLLPLSRSLAGRLLYEASGGDPWAEERAASDYIYSFLPGSKQFVIFSGDGTYLWSLYHQSDDRYYIMRADGVRYYNLQLRDAPQSDAKTAVYETLRQLYGAKDFGRTLPGFTYDDTEKAPAQE